MAAVVSLSVGCTMSTTARAAGTANSTGTNNGYYYSFWSDGGGTTATTTTRATTTTTSSTASRVCDRRPGRDRGRPSCVRVQL